MKHNYWLIAFLIVFHFGNFVKAESVFDLSEDELFADTSIYVDSSSIVKLSTSFGVIDSTTVSFSGQLSSSAGMQATRNFFEKINRDEISLFALSTGNLILDVRLPLDVKGFANTELSWRPDSGKTYWGLQEIFLDVNVAKRAYFRVGKQVLQWGRCSIWNPTDLINVEKKSLQKDLGSREGAYGLRMHIPFGTKWNIYGFLDMNDLSSTDSIAGSGKIESLIGITEIGVALWGKPGRDPVCGIDFSTSLLDFSIAGELSLTSGKNYSVPDGDGFIKIGQEMSIPMTTIDEDIVARLCIGISRTFDLLSVNDRMMINAEYYYNQAGYLDNLFKQYHISDIIENFANVEKNNNSSMNVQSVLNKIYEPNNHSRHYIGLTSMISKFIISDMALTLSGIGNISQHCAIIISGISYRNMYNYMLGLELAAMVGPKDTEYTFSGNALTLNVYTGIAF